MQQQQCSSLSAPSAAVAAAAAAAPLAQKVCSSVEGARRGTAGGCREAGDDDDDDADGGVDGRGKHKRARLSSEGMAGPPGVGGSATNVLVSPAPAASAPAASAPAAPAASAPAAPTPAALPASAPAVPAARRLIRYEFFDDLDRDMDAHLADLASSEDEGGGGSGVAGKLGAANGGARGAQPLREKPGQRQVGAKKGAAPPGNGLQSQARARAGKGFRVLGVWGFRGFRGFRGLGGLGGLGDSFFSWVTHP